MKYRVAIGIVGVVCFFSSAGQLAVAQDKATPQEVVKKVQEAAASLAKSGEPGLAMFNQKAAPWVWKDSYVFVLDCAKVVVAAHPMKPDLIGTNTKDAKGTDFISQICAGAKSPSGVWAEFWLPKPGEKEPSRKIGYALKAGDTSYVAAAAIFNDTVTMKDLAGLSIGSN